MSERSVTPKIYVASISDSDYVSFLVHEVVFGKVTRVTQTVREIERCVYVKDAAGKLGTKTIKEEVTAQVEYTEDEPVGVNAATSKVHLDNLTAYNRAGDIVETEDVRWPLSQPRPVLVSASRDVVAPEFLALLSDDALVFVSSDRSFPLRPCGEAEADLPEPPENA